MLKILLLISDFKLFKELIFLLNQLHVNHKSHLSTYYHHVSHQVFKALEFHHACYYLQMHG